jgi:hypothetical protein
LTLILDPGRWILHHWVATAWIQPRLHVGDHIESIELAISCVRAADFMISIDS